MISRNASLPGFDWQPIGSAPKDGTTVLTESGLAFYSQVKGWTGLAGGVGFAIPEPKLWVRFIKPDVAVIPPAPSLHEPTYTPGPWKFVQIGDESACVHIHDDCVVSGAYRGGESDLLAPADARLIAAAPDLLEALDAMVDEWERVQGLLLPEDHQAKTAISKAKGTK